MGRFVNNELLASLLSVSFTGAAPRRFLFRRSIAKDEASTPDQTFCYFRIHKKVGAMKCRIGMLFYCTLASFFCASCFLKC